MKRAILVLTAGAALAACGSSKCAPACLDAGTELPDLVVATGCQPLMAGVDAGGDCLLPYPSDFFRVADATMPSGFHIDHSAARPAAAHGHNTNVNDFFAIDGYSRQPVIVATFPEAMKADGFVGLFDDPASSTAIASNTLLVEADTGALIPHYVDLDPRATDPKRQAIVIHPYAALKEKTRYVVAIHGVKNTDGNLVATPEGFARQLRADAWLDNAASALTPHFKSDVFPVLAHAGVDTASLQLAWDFTTGSDARTQGDMLHIRDLTRAWLAANTPAVTITSITPGTVDDTWYTVEGTVTGPYYLNGTDGEPPLQRDASGAVVQNGTVDIPFTALVPAALRDQYGPGLPVAYGHGFFGKRDEVTYDSTRALAQDFPAVLFGIDWWGMATADATIVAGNMTDHPSHTMDFADRVHQAMSNWMVMTAAIKGPLRTNAAFTRSTDGGAGVEVAPDGGTNAGDCIFEPGVQYLGISQGAILGTTMNAVNPDTQHVVLQMGGAGFTHMMFRALPFDSFLYFLGLGLPDPLEQQKFVATLQPQFDRFDPATWASHLLTAPLDGAPADRHVFMQNGLGDAEVPNLGTYLLARNMGMPNVTPSPFAPYALASVAAPVDGSGLVLYDFGVDVKTLDAQAIPPADNNTVHDDLRKYPPAIAQMQTFLETGTIVDFCDGGACYTPPGF